MPIKYSNQTEQPRQRGHVLASAPIIDLNAPGRLRTQHVLALFAFSHSTLYSRIASGLFPKPDGRDGRLIYWRTDTIRELLRAPAPVTAS